METPRKDREPAQRPKGALERGRRDRGSPLRGAQRIREEIAKVIVGQEPVIDHMLVGLLCRGHILLAGCARAGQDTDGPHPGADARPGVPPHPVHARPDAFGHHRHGHHRGRPGDRPSQAGIPPGPIFTNFLLADEINRTPPKTQAALLQAMQEREVSIGRRTYSLNPPFFVVATQNPIEMEGTYPLPEAQLDRFMFNLKVKYPTIKEELSDRQGDDRNAHG